MLLKSAAAVLIALADLAEAEGRNLRRQVGRIGFGLVLYALAGAGAAAGLGLTLWACFLFLQASLGLPGSAGLCGLMALLLAGGFAWLAKRLTR